MISLNILFSCIVAHCCRFAMSVRSFGAGFVFVVCAFHHIYHRRESPFIVCTLEIANASNDDVASHTKKSEQKQRTHQSANCLLLFKPLEVPLVEQKSRLQDFLCRRKSLKCFLLIFLSLGLFFVSSLYIESTFITEQFLCSGWLGYQDKSA